MRTITRYQLSDTSPPPYPTKDTEVDTFEGGRYTDNVQACIY